MISKSSLKLNAILSIVGICLFLTGCVHVTQLHQTPKGLVLERHSSTNLDVTYYAPELPQARGHSVEVILLSPPKTIDPATASVEQLKPEDWEPWRLDCQKHIAGKLYQAGIFKDVSTPNDITPLATPDLRFVIAMTEWNEGTGWLRFIVGFGAGRTTMQWEGILTDSHTQRVLFAFGDKREHPGGPSMLGFNFKPFHGATLIAEDLRWGTTDLIDTLRKQTGTTQEIDETTFRPESHSNTTAGTPIHYAGPPPVRQLAPSPPQQVMHGGKTVNTAPPPLAKTAAPKAHEPPPGNVQNTPALPGLATQ